MSFDDADDCNVCREFVKTLHAERAPRDGSRHPAECRAAGEASMANFADEAPCDAEESIAIAT